MRGIKPVTTAYRLKYAAVRHGVSALKSGKPT
jgi:hypothetical protein